MKLHYETYGPCSGTPIVLLHGFLSSSAYWHNLVPLLPEGRRIIAIDLLGFGKSPKPRKNSYSRAEHAKAVLDTVRDILGDASFVLAGHSMGSLVAAEVAHQLPGQISKLILFNAPVLTDPHQARSVFASTSKLYKAMLYTPFGRIGWPIAKQIAASPLSYIVPKPLKPIAKSSAKNTHISRKRSLTSTIEQTNGIELLRRITVPTIFIGGLRDREVYRHNLATNARTLPANIDIVWVDAGHHIPAKLPTLARSFI